MGIYGSSFPPTFYGPRATRKKTRFITSHTDLALSYKRYLFTFLMELIGNVSGLNRACLPGVCSQNFKEYKAGSSATAKMRTPPSGLQQAAFRTMYQLQCKYHYHSD